VDTASITSQTARVRLSELRPQSYSPCTRITLGKGVLTRAGRDALGAVTAMSVQHRPCTLLRRRGRSVPGMSCRRESWCPVPWPRVRGSRRRNEGATMTGEQAHIQDLHVADRSVRGDRRRSATPPTGRRMCELAAAGTLAPERRSFRAPSDTYQHRRLMRSDVARKSRASRAASQPV
jgi:hypothetical protein